MGYSWKRARLSLKSKRYELQFRFQQEQIGSLKELEDNEYIDLYFGDESHFGLTPNVSYAWQTKENPILLPSSKGKYQNVVGLMTRKNKIYFEVHETTFNSDKMINFLNNFVNQTLKKTVVILHNSSIHRSKKLWQKLKKGKKTMF